MHELLIFVLLGLLLLAALMVLARGLSSSRLPADDTLVTDLLGPPDLPAAPERRVWQEPGRRAWQKAAPAPTPTAREVTVPAPSGQAPAAGGSRSVARPLPPPGDEEWLDSQLAWITAWSQQMQQQITSADQPD
jgi:hypothetical protein